MNSNENETPINVSNEISRDIQNIQNLEPNESNGTSIAATENKINEAENNGVNATPDSKDNNIINENKEETSNEKINSELNKDSTDSEEQVKPEINDNNNENQNNEINKPATVENNSEGQSSEINKPAIVENNSEGQSSEINKPATVENNSEGQSSEINKPELTENNNIDGEKNNNMENNNDTETSNKKDKMKQPAEDSAEENNIGSNEQNEQKIEEQEKEAKAKQKEKEENIYKLKVIEKKNEYQGIIQQKNIITQNINGPCPLLALCNILILRGDISIPLKKKEITYEEIIDILGDYIARNTNKGNNNDNNDTGNEYDFQDVLDIIPTLKKGLDINVNFDSVLSFEPSPALTVFKFFNIKLVHGWTVDPEDEETFRIIAKECGNYNKVVEKIIECDSACASRTNLNSSQESINTKNKQEELYHTGMVCKNFIETNATQLTYHGLASIPDVLEVGEPTAFFRNNHFLTLIKTEDNNMYTLVTDQGFVNEKKIVWETLSTIDGDSYFVDGLFKKYDDRPNTDLILNSPNEDLDYAIALSLQEDEENKRNERIQRMNENNIRKSQTYSSKSNSHNKNSKSNSRRNSNPSNSRKNTNNNNYKSNDNDDKCILM
jgi:hypothetical protein